MENYTESEDVELYSSLVEYEISQICAILEDNKISFIRKDYGSGGYMNLYYGQSIQEKKVFVHKNDYDKAAEIISVFLDTKLDNNNEQTEQDPKEDDNDNYKKYKLIRTLFKVYLIGLPLILIILFIIAYIFYY